MPDAKIITLFSAKGGVGKTVLATNLAVSLAKDKSIKVLLLDIDSRVVGDMARMLDLVPTKSLLEVIDLMETPGFDISKIKDFLINHSSGVDFIPAILKPQQAPSLEPQKIVNALNLIKTDYDYVVIDAGCGFSALLVNILNESNLILPVATPEVVCVSQTKWLLETLEGLFFSQARIKIILNRAESKSSMGFAELIVALKSEIIAQIPSEGKNVVEATNRGVPVVIDDPRCKFSRALDAFANRLITSPGIFSDIESVKTEAVEEAASVANDQTNQLWEKTGILERSKESFASAMRDEMIVLKKRVHQRLLEALNLKRLDIKAFNEQDKDELRRKAERMVTGFLSDEDSLSGASMDVRVSLVKEILDEALGLGALEDLLADPTITDIMVNNKDQVYIERNGIIELSGKRFTSDEQVRTVIERIIAPIGRRIDESVPMVDARLQDGSRVNAIIPPLSLTGPAVTIRKFRKEIFTVEELVKLGSLNEAMVKLIKACVVSRQNIIVSGGTGSGKTSTLNLLSTFIPPKERIVTIEDAAELKLKQKHWIRLESRPPNMEGKGSITIRDLFRNTLRMRPDRIIVGECRGVETLDMLQAMNTGHDGSMTTLHANSTQDVLMRLDSMILMSGVELPIRAIREMISSAINLIIHTARLSDGTRKVLQVSELTGMLDDIHINIQDIFSFNQTGIDKSGKVQGEFKPTGFVPTFYEKLKVMGIDLPKEMFQP